MPLEDDLPSSSPGPGTSLEDNLRYYKKQYEILESELADFQASSKELEAELEKDIEASEKRERQLKDKASNLQYEVDEWKAKHKQAKSEAASAQTALQKEITELRDTNRTLQLRLRDTEVANDDYERQQRNTESSLEDMESKYNQTIERSVMLEEEMRVGEQEREALRIEAQRLKDELSDFKIETDIIREKLSKAEAVIAHRSHLTIDPVAVSASPRSELSPTTTDTSFDTPPAKTASSSGLSDTPTPPSPPVSERSVHTAKSKPQAFATPSIPRSRPSLGSNLPTPRQPVYSASRQSTSTAGHVRGPSIPAIQRTGPSSTHTRQSFGRAGGIPQRTGLPQSSSILHLRNLRSKMQNLEARVHTARSKLPGPVNTPPRASPRSGSALGAHIPASVTVRSRKRAGGSTISGTISHPDSDDTPSAPRTKPSRTSLYTSRDMPPPTPTHPTTTFNSQAMPAPTSRPTSRSGVPPSRPDSRASARPDSRASARHSFIGPPPTTTLTSRPQSRQSLTHHTNFSSRHPPNASTDRIRPPSALSSHGGYDGTHEYAEDDSILEMDEPGTTDIPTPTPRRTSFMRPSRTSDVGGGASGIPSPTKRASIGGLGGGMRGVGSVVGRRQSQSHLVGGGGGAGGGVGVNGGGGGKGHQRSESAQGSRRESGFVRPPSRIAGGVAEEETY